MTKKKKLIEVALPLEAINKACAYEKMPGIGPHPRGLHQWWARRPLAAARAVIFAQMVDDPSAHPDLFPTDKAQEKERQRLYRILEELILWENSTNEAVIQAARDEIWQSWRYACAENADHPAASELYNRYKLPSFHDPFSGGGALPLEAKRLGLESYASDLNPVAVLINKAMIEIPVGFAGKPPINPEARQTAGLKTWKGSQGIAEDVRYYGQWLRSEVEKKVGHLYPKIEITEEMVMERPDLRPYLGKELTVIAWIWARTVKSPNPAYANVDVPLVSSYLLSTKPGKEAYVFPMIENGNYRFTVKIGTPKDEKAAKHGTKLARGANFCCLMSGTPMEGDYIKAEGKAGRMSARLMAIVAGGERGRIYLSPSLEHEEIANAANPHWKSDLQLSEDKRAFWTPAYGVETYGDLFTPRQLVILTTLSDMLQEMREKVYRDACTGGLPEDDKPLCDGGAGAIAYAEAIETYLAFAVDRCCEFSNSCARWGASNQKVMNLFGRQAIPMVWDYAEANVLAEAVGGFSPSVEFIADCINTLPHYGHGKALQQDAMKNTITSGKIVSTDPPYYDNIGYADLSDFFYIWLRRSLQSVFPDQFSTVAVPKVDELVATPYRHDSKEKAEVFFLKGMTQAMYHLAKQAHPAFPVTIYYAFKQSETASESGTASTGWETFLDAVIHAGFAITGTWPMRSEQEYRMIGSGTNALASSIVLVCRPRPTNPPTITRREFIASLKTELPSAVAHLQKGNIAPVDLAQAAIGPGMAIFTRYSKVLDAIGNPMSVREALALINQTLDEVLAEQEGDFDADSRWALAWFEQSGFSEGEYGVAETLSKAKNTSVTGMVEAGILVSKAGKVRLLQPKELPVDWDPEQDSRLTAWEMVHQLIRVLEKDGEYAAAGMAARLGAKAEIARELCYRLYTLCERKKRASLALSYNALVQSWPEIIRLAKEGGKRTTQQSQLFEEE